MTAPNRRPFMSPSYVVPVNRLHHTWTDCLIALPRGNGLCLDVGAGNGRHKSWIEDAGWRWIGLDIAHHSALGIVGDACSLPFADQSVDLLFANQLLEHIPSPMMAVAEAYRVLRPGARLVGSTSFLEPWHDSYFGFTHWAIEQMMSAAGFRLVEIRPGTSAFVTMASALLPDTRLGPWLGGAAGRVVMASLKWIGGVYTALRFGRRSHQWQQYQAFLEKAPLRFAGHIMFVAEKPDSAG